MSEQISHELLNKIQLKTLSNIAAKAKAGGIPTAAELKIFKSLVGQQQDTEKPIVATAPEDDGGVVYKNRMQAFQELKRLGYKIGKSKFYGHCSKPGESNGICRVEKNGSVTETSLRRYVKHPGSQLESTGDGEGAVVAEEQRAKLRMENERLEMQNQKLRLEIATMEGRYIERDQVYLELAARAAVFEHGLRHWWNMNAIKLVELVLKDQENARDLILNAGLRGMDDQMNEFARAETFKVLFGNPIAMRQEGKETAE